MNTPHKKECCFDCEWRLPESDLTECGNPNCKCHTPPQEKGWREALTKAAQEYAGDYVRSCGNYADPKEEPKALAAFIEVVQEQITATEKRVREEILKDVEYLRALINNK